MVQNYLVCDGTRYPGQATTLTLKVSNVEYQSANIAGWSYFMTPDSLEDNWQYANGPLSEASTVPSFLFPGMDLDPTLGTADCSALTGADVMQCYAEKLVY